MPTNTATDQRPAVCIVRHNYYPDGHVRRDAEALANDGYDVSVVSLRRPGQPQRECLNGVNVYRQPVQHVRGSVLRYVWEYVSFLVLAFLTVTALHARKRFQVVEVDNMPDVLVLSALIPKLTGARVLFYIFDNMPELLQTTRRVGKGHPLVRVLAFLEWASASFADHVIVTQEAARQLVQSRGVPASKVEVVLNCPDEAIFVPASVTSKQKREDAFEIVTHGLILERFGIQVLLDALPLIAKEIPQARLHVIGAGEYRSQLQERVLQNGLMDRVQFTDWVPLEELPVHLRRADVGYVGMLCDFMLSNKLMEYVALGVPVVLARWPTYEHYFSDEAVSYFRAGDATELASAVLSTYRRPDLARQRADQAMHLFQHYRWSVQREVYLGVYAKLLARSPRRAVLPGRHESSPSIRLSA